MPVGTEIQLGLIARGTSQDIDHIDRILIRVVFCRDCVRETLFAFTNRRSPVIARFLRRRKQEGGGTYTRDFSPYFAIVQAQWKLRFIAAVKRRPVR